MMEMEKRKPPVGKTSGLLKIDVLAGKIDNQEDSPNLHSLQAARIRSRFAMSWPLAGVVAELAYGRPA